MAITKRNQKLGRKIQRLRRLQNFTQEQLAEKLGISRTHMGHLEQGRRSPSLKLLDKIARILRVKTSDLLS